MATPGPKPTSSMLSRSRIPSWPITQAAQSRLDRAMILPPRRPRMPSGRPNMRIRMLRAKLIGRWPICPNAFTEFKRRKPFSGRMAASPDRRGRLIGLGYRGFGRRRRRSARARRGRHDAGVRDIVEKAARALVPAHGLGIVAAGGARKRQRAEPGGAHFLVELRLRRVP